MTTAYWRRKERLYSFIHSFGLELGLESSCFKIQVSYDQYRATRASELQSFEQRYENAQNTVKHRKTPYFSRSCNG